MDDILDILIAHGVPGSVIVRVAKLIADNQATEDRRTKNRERMRAVRARAHTQAHTETQPKEHIKKDPSFPNTEIQKKGRKKVSMPIDWKLTDADRAFATAKSWPQHRIDTEAERFRDYWLANGKPMADWAACWRKWVTSPYQNEKGAQQHGRRHGSVLDAADRLREKLKQAGATDDYVPGSSGPRPLQLDHELRPANLRLIPKG